MNFLKNLFLMCLFVTSAATQVLFADETTGEKVAVTTNKLKRNIKKGSHRLQEAVCAESDLKCAAKKVKNRTVEVKDATVDGVREVKHKID